jgi:transcriptional regulator with XRE-family HTH domain
MGRAGKALKQALITYGISQNQLAVAMGVGHANVRRWVNEVTHILHQLHYPPGTQVPG